MPRSGHRRGPTPDAALERRAESLADRVGNNGGGPLTLPERAALLADACPSLYRSPPPPESPVTATSRAERVEQLRARHLAGLGLWHAGDQVRAGVWDGRNGTACDLRRRQADARRFRARRGRSG
jgi:hypothetical protein